MNRRIVRKRRQCLYWLRGPPLYDSKLSVPPPKSLEVLAAEQERWPKAKMQQDKAKHGGPEEEAAIPVEGVNLVIPLTKVTSNSMEGAGNDALDSLERIGVENEILTEEDVGRKTEGGTVVSGKADVTGDLRKTGLGERDRNTDGYNREGEQVHRDPQAMLQAKETLTTQNLGQSGSVVEP